MSNGVYYGDYLRLDRLLSAQRPESGKLGKPAHDEMLFIIVHQAYELWFKQILHELDRVQDCFAAAPLASQKLGLILHGLDRTKRIFDLVVRQIDVLETMTALDFLDFRDLLRPASGFQSLQFRLIETRLGLTSEARVEFGGRRFEERLSEEDRKAVHAASGRPSLLDQLESWLARTPFLTAGDYAFTQVYRQAVVDMLRSDIGASGRATGLAAGDADADQAALSRALEAFRGIFEPGGSGGLWRMKPQAVQAALFIILYRDQPALQGPFRLLELLMDIDEAMTMWRYRHAVMVERMIGVKLGTGGSSGHGYLRQTAERHRVFTDLFRLSTYLIPRALVPPLPDGIARRLAFVYQAGEGAG
jgi:tryptophan 2,3-dioxygenase